MRLTPIERRMMLLLQDGQAHKQLALVTCLHDDQATRANIKPHISHLRGKLRPLGLDLLCEFINRNLCYRLAALVTPPHPSLTFLSEKPTAP